MTTRSPLAALSVLKKICDHPQLLTGQVAYRYGGLILRMKRCIERCYMRACLQPSLAGPRPRRRVGVQGSVVSFACTPGVAINITRRMQPAKPKDDIDITAMNDEQLLAAIMEPPSCIEEEIEQSGKMACLSQLLKQLAEEGHRVLVFSQSKKMLNAVSQVLDHHQLTYCALNTCPLLNNAYTLADAAIPGWMAQ
jgi:SNF2 family DNA or RNA helicase